MVWRLVLCACGLVAWGVSVVWVAVAGRFRAKKPPKRLRRRNQMLARRKRRQAAMVLDPEDPPTWDTEGQHERRWEGWALDGDGIPVCQHPSYAGQVAVPVEGWFEVEVTRRPIPGRDQERPVYTRPPSAGKNSPVSGVSEAPVRMPEHGLPEGRTVETHANVSGQEQVPLETPDYEGCGDGDVDLEIWSDQVFEQEMSPLELAMIWMNQIYEGISDLEEENEEAKKNEANEQKKMEEVEAKGDSQGKTEEKEKVEEEDRSKTEDERFDPEKAGDEQEEIETKEDDRNDKEPEANSQADEEPKKDSVREAWRTFSRIQVPKRSRSCESCGEKEDEDESDIWRRFHRQGWQCPSWEERTKTPDRSTSDKTTEEPELSNEEISQASCDDLPLEVLHERQKMPEKDEGAVVPAPDTKEVRVEPEEWLGNAVVAKEEIEKIFVEVPDETKPGAAEEDILPAAEPDEVKLEPKKEAYVSIARTEQVVPDFSSKVFKKMPALNEVEIVPAPNCKEAKHKAKKRNWFSKLFKRRQCGEKCCPKELFKTEGKMTLKKKLKRLYCCGRPVF